MPHRTCSAASHAAHILIEHYQIALRPPHELPAGTSLKLKADEACLGIMIDLTTNAHAIALLRPEMKYWLKLIKLGVNDTHTCDQIRFFLRRLALAIEGVPHYRDESEFERVGALLPASGTAPHPALILPDGGRKQILLTKASVEATKTILAHYTLTPRDPKAFTDPRAVRLEVARHIDVCLGLRHALRALPSARKCYDELTQGRLTPEQVGEALDDISAHLTALPKYQDGRDETKLLVA